MKEPLQLFEAWYTEAQKGALFPAETVALATATADGKPSVRYVYYRGPWEGGLGFFTNYESRKGEELLENPYAALAFFWPHLGRQLRVEGRVKRLSTASSDEYFAQRPRESQLSAVASRQSQKLESREEYLKEVERLSKEFKGSVPRPHNWGGFALLPERWEFWKKGENRRHDRQVFTKEGNAWTSQLLYP